MVFILLGCLLVKHLFFWAPLSGKHFYKKNTTLFIAHRGLHKNESENTTLAIKKAIKLGFTAVELDTLMSLDKKIVFRICFQFLGHLLMLLQLFVRVCVCLCVCVSTCLHVFDCVCGTHKMTCAVYQQILAAALQQALSESDH